MTKLILVRHGQSEANLTRTYAGHSHIPLTELGKKQADRAGKYISENYKVDKIYASDCLRAFTTACGIANHLGMMEICTDYRLREVEAGKWEGRSFIELEKAYPEEYEKWRSDILNFWNEDGETVRQMHERFFPAVKEIAEKNDGKTVVIATHATPVRSMTTQVIYGSIDRMDEVPWAKNASITVINYENGEFSLELQAFEGHLLNIDSDDTKI